MAHIFNYALIRLVPFAHRGELLNVGVVVFRPDGIDVRLRAQSNLMSYFNISSRAIEWIGSRLRETDDPSLELNARVASLSRATGYTLSEIGWFTVDADSQYEHRIEDVILEYVDRPRQIKVRRKTNNIARKLRVVFKDYEIYSKNISDIENHKVVSNMPVGPSGRLHVDFMLKNSIYHATETIDFSNSDHAGAAEIKNAALASVTFQHAKESLSNFGIRCYLVYSAATMVEKAVEPALAIARHDAVDSFNLESREDKIRYLDIMLNAAGINSLI